MRGVIRPSDNLLNYVLVSAGLQEGYGFPENLKKIEESDRSLLAISSLSLKLPKLLQRASGILRYFLGSSVASTFDDAIVFLDDLAKSIKKHNPIGLMLQVSDVYSELAPGLMDHFLDSVKADDMMKLASITRKIERKYYSQYWENVRPDLEEKVQKASEQLAKMHAQESIAAILGRNICENVEIRMIDCLRQGPAFSAYPKTVYLPPGSGILESEGLDRALLPSFAHELTHLILRNAKIFTKEAIAAPIKKIREIILPGFLDIGFEVMLVEHPLTTIVEEKVYNRYEIPLPHWWGRVNPEDFSSVCNEEMRSHYVEIWDELQNADNDKFACLVGNIIEASQDELFSVFRNLLK